MTSSGRSGSTPRPSAAFKRRKGAVLQVFSAEDGSLVKSHSLASPLAFDGLSAALGRLYLAILDGRVICFGEGKRLALQTTAGSKNY